MRMRPLGNTGIKVPEIGLGTWGLSGEGYGPCAIETARETIEAAFDNGCAFVDVSPAYAHGAILSTLGDVFAARGRESGMVCVRIGVERNAHTGGAHKAFDPPSIAAQADAALAALRTDHVDALVLHNPLVQTLQQYEVTDALVKMREAGKTRTIGVSVSSLQTARLVLKVGVDFMMLPYNLLYPRLLHTLAADIKETGVGVLVRSPLAYGLLGGTWYADQQFGEHDHRRHRWTSTELAQRVRQREAARFLVHNQIHTLSQAAICFVLSNQLVSCAIVGSRSGHHVRENAMAAPELPYLPPKDLAMLADRMREEDIEF